MTNHLVLARKYRPQKFAEIVGQKFTVQTLKNALQFKKTAHAYLFCGPKGVGKTSVARIFARALNCQNIEENFEPCNSCSSCREILNGQSLDVIEIDGASNRGIEDIRQINETVSYAPSCSYKIYIIDEVHMLTKEAFNALLKTLEEPPSTMKFFFATTEAHKIPSTILSRCQRFNLQRVSAKQVQENLTKIAQDLHRSIQPDALNLLSEYTEGSMRDAQTLFEQILCFTEKELTLEIVEEALGLMHNTCFFSLDEAISTKNYAYAFSLAEDVFSKGIDPLYFLEQLSEHYRKILAVKLGSSTSFSEKYIQTSTNYTLAQCEFLIDYLIHMQKFLANSSFKKGTLEMILLKLLQSKDKTTLADLFSRLIALEEGLQRGKIDTPEQKDTQPSIPNKVALVETPFSSDLPPETTKEKSFAEFETIMRFAAVELEGSLQIEKRRKANG